MTRYEFLGLELLGATRRLIKLSLFLLAGLPVLLCASVATAQYQGTGRVVHVHTPSHTSDGYLQVIDLAVAYSDANGSTDNFSVACSVFAALSRERAGGSIVLKMDNKREYVFSDPSWKGCFHHAGSDDQLKSCSLRKKLLADCDEARALAAAAKERAEEAKEANEREAREAEEAKERAVQEAGEASERAIREATEAKARAAEEAAQAAKFRGDILALWHAAEEPDPFASIRGDFDLSSSNSHQWKTSLLLQGAEKCALIKTAPTTPKSASAWTFACKLPATGDGYEGVVKTVQSILHLPFQPDERAMMINQVFFADPARPARRLFIAKIGEGTTGVSVVAVRYAGVVPGHLNAGPFPSLTTMLSATPPAIPPAVPPTAAPIEPTIHDEVESIRNEPHGQMPPAQRSSASGTAWGTTTMTVQNSTPYELTVLYDGPVSKKLTLAPGTSQALDLAPGAYHVAGRVSDAAVLPFYGEESYDGSANYSESFYIVQR